MHLDRKDKIFIGASLVLALLWYDVHRREQERVQEEYRTEQYVAEEIEEQERVAVVGLKNVHRNRLFLLLSAKPQVIPTLSLTKV
jgi:hypothetical protein